MSDYTVVRGPRSGDPHPRLRLAALTAVITGVLLVAAAAFLLSYTGIHQIALLAGVSPTLARLYPVMFDAMLVIACAAALALRSAGWPTRLYVWLSLLVLLGAVAAGDALYAMAISLPVQPTQAVVAIIPWVLLLMGFVMWLLMLRYWRRFRAAAAYAAAGAGGGAAAAATARWAGGRGGAGAAVGGRTGAAAAPMRAAAPRAAIDTLLEPRPQRQTGRTASSASRPAAKDDAATGTYPEKKNDRAGNGGQGGNGGTAQRAGQTGNGGQTQGASQTQGAEQAEDGGKAGNAGQAHDPGHAHEQDQDMYDDGTRTGLTYEAPESLSPETPSAGAPSPETPSAGAPSAETPSAGAPSPETPSAGAPPPETPSAGAPPPETPSAGAPPPETPSAGAPPPGAPASGAEPSETGTPADATMPEAGSGSYQPGTGGPGQTGDQASAPPIAPAPTPVPRFDRMRSTPTPPQDPEADEE